MGQQIEGKANEGARKSREAAGDATDNEEMQAEGQEQQAEGKAQQLKGDVKDKIEDATDKLRNPSGAELVPRERGAKSAPLLCFHWANTHGTRTPRRPTI